MKRSEILLIGRERAGITQAEFAQRCGLSLVTVGRCERGLTEPKIENMVRMCQVLNIPFEEMGDGYAEELYKAAEKMKPAEKEVDPDEEDLVETFAPVGDFIEKEGYR